VNTNERPRPKSFFKTFTLFFLVLVPLTLLVVLFDNSLVEQLKGLVNSHSLPAFAASTRLLAYVIAPYAITRRIGKFQLPGWLTCLAYCLSLLICVCVFWR
jgi:hypothetical protein